MTGTVQECCGAPLPGPHPIASSMSYLLTPYGDIHGGMSSLLTSYGDSHTRQLLPVYTRMIVASFNFTLQCHSLSETIQYKVTSSAHLTPPGLLSMPLGHCLVMFVSSFRA